MPQKRVSQKFVLQLLELKCMAVEEKQLYLRGESRPKIEPCLDMFETKASYLRYKVS